MKIRFLPEGGFNKNGAFIEYEGDEPMGDELEYERSGFISLDIVFDQLEVRTVAGVANEYDEVSENERTITKLLTGHGRIQPARWGQFTLSFLGHKKNHRSVGLTIRSHQSAESAVFAGLFAEADLDVQGWDEFFLEIRVHASRFDALVSELAEDKAHLRVHVDTSKFPNFYATWSPSISEGRVVKYLENKRGIENADDIPDEFWLDSSERRELLSNIDDPPVNIGVVRPLKSPTLATEHDNELESDVDDLNFPEEGSTEKDEQSLQIERNSALLAMVNTTTLLTTQVKRTGFWIIVCLIVLVLAVLAK
jgi:hypothetical protein